MLDRHEERLANLESHVEMLDMIQQLLLRLMSVMHPLSNVLVQYGANSGQEQEVLLYLDELAERVHSLERTRRPTFEDFQTRIGDILPAFRDDREFLRLVIDTLSVERAAYRELHEYMTAQGWLNRALSPSRV